jgi:insertion element IS1 protein InsB
MVVQPTAALRLHHKKQKYKCKTCGRQYIVGVAARRVNPTKKYIDLSVIKLIEKLLLERISLRGIARVVDVSIKWLQTFVNKFYRHISCEMKVTAPKTINLIVECDLVEYVM